jgi:undecaprenyl-diphosphatase
MLFRDFFDFLYKIDVAVFSFINHNFSSTFMDWFMEIITDFDFSRKVLILVIVVVALWRWRLKALWVFLLIGLAVGLSDLFSSQILKKTICRIRPCHVIENVRLVVGCSSSFSFPSSHCANTFGFLTVLMRLYPKAIAALLPYGLLLAVSRVYVGVHYPSDALGGMAVGIASGLFVVFVGKFLESRFKDTNFANICNKVNAFSFKERNGRQAI